MKQLNPSRDCRRGRAVLLVATLGLLAQPVAAGEVTDAWILRFNLPEQSVWGPGGPGGVRYQGGPLATSGPLTGSGLAIDAQASAGVVSGNVEGWLNVRHDSVLELPGWTTMTLNYQGIENESRIETRTVFSVVPKTGSL